MQVQRSKSYETIYARENSQVGYRVWKLCDAKTTYVLNFEVYTGAEDGKVTKELAYKVTMRRKAIKEKIMSLLWIIILLGFPYF